MSIIRLIKHNMNKHIVKVIGLVFIIMLTAGCTVNVKQDQSTQDVGARTDNSGFKLISSAGNLISQLRDDVNTVDLQGADLDNVGEATITTSTVTEYASSTAVRTDALTVSTLTSSSIPYISTAGLMAENNSTMYTDGTSAYFTSLYSGIFSLPQNGGLVSFLDIPVTTGAAAGTEEGYNMLVDGLVSFSVLRESNGAGTVANTTTLRTGSFECKESVNLQGQTYWKYVDGITEIISTTTPCN